MSSNRLAQQLDAMAEYVSGFLQKDEHRKPMSSFDDKSPPDFSAIESKLQALKLQSAMDRVLDAGIEAARPQGMVMKNGETQNVFAMHYVSPEIKSTGAGQAFDGSVFDAHEDFGSVIKKAYSLEAKDDGLITGMTRNQACLAATSEYIRAVKAKAGIGEEQGYRVDLIMDVIDVAAQRQYVTGIVSNSIGALQAIKKEQDEGKREVAMVKAAGQLLGLVESFQRLADIARSAEQAINQAANIEKIATALGKQEQRLDTWLTKWYSKSHGVAAQDLNNIDTAYDRSATRKASNRDRILIAKSAIQQYKEGKLPIAEVHSQLSELLLSKNMPEPKTRMSRFFSSISTTNRVLKNALKALEQTTGYKPAIKSVSHQLKK